MVNPCQGELGSFQVEHLESGRASYRYAKFPRCEICGNRTPNDDTCDFFHAGQQFRDQLKIAYPAFKDFVETEFMDEDLICASCHQAVWKTSPFGTCQIRSCGKHRELVQASGNLWATYVDRCKKASRDLELKEDQWMCIGCWGKTVCANMNTSLQLPLCQSRSVLQPQMTALERQLLPLLIVRAQLRTRKTPLEPPTPVIDLLGRDEVVLRK